MSPKEGMRENIFERDEYKLIRTGWRTIKG
jgi:hypothetical protein